MKPILNEPSRIAMRQTIRTLTQKEQNPVAEERIRKKKLKTKPKMDEEITYKQINKASDETIESIATKMQVQKIDSGSSSKEEIISMNNLQKKQTVSEKINKPLKLSLIDRLFIRPISKIEIKQPNSSQLDIEDIKQQSDQVVEEEEILPTNIDNPSDSSSTPLENNMQQKMEEEVQVKLGESETKFSDEDEEKRKKTKTKKPEMQGAHNCVTKLPNDRVSMTSKPATNGGTLTKRQAALEKWRQMGRRRNECERRHRERRIRKLNKY